MRYAMGDTPLRDEFINPHRMFDVLLTPLFQLWPEIPLLTMRKIGMWLGLLTAFGLFLAFRGLAPDGLLAAACATAAFVPHRIFTPGYHAMGMSFFVLAWSCWWTSLGSGKSRRAMAWGALAGLFAWLATMSYLPFVALLTIPAALLLRDLRSRAISSDVARWRPTATLLLTTGLLTFFTFLVLFWKGLHVDWWYGHKALSRTGIYASSVSEKLEGSLWVVLPLALAVTAASAAVFRAMAAVLKHAGAGPTALLRALLIGVTAAGLCWLILVKTPAFHPAIDEKRVILRTRFTLMAFGIHFGAWLLRSRDRSSTPLAVRLFFWSSLAFALLHAVLSNHAHKIAWAALPLFVSAIVGFHGRLAGTLQSSTARRSATLAVTVLCFLIGITTYHSQTRFAYQYGNPKKFTESFTCAPLKGIRSTPHRVRKVERILEFLDGKLKPGEYLLAYDSLPLFHYLTRTKPSLNTVWVSRSSPRKVREESLEYMLRNQRLPRYCIARSRDKRSLVDGDFDPTHAWVEKHCESVFKVSDLEIFKRRLD